MKIQILDEAEQDLVDGFNFYEVQSPGLGNYFIDSLFSDIYRLSSTLCQHSRSSLHVLSSSLKTFSLYHLLSGFRENRAYLCHPRLPAKSSLDRRTIEIAGEIHDSSGFRKPIFKNGKNSTRHFMAPRKHQTV